MRNRAQTLLIIDIACIQTHTVSETSWIDQHFDALLGATIATVFGISAAVFTLYRRIMQVETNEAQIKNIERKLDIEIAKADKDHTEIRKAVQSTRETQAKQSADLEHIKRTLDRLLDKKD